MIRRFLSIFWSLLVVTSWSYGQAPNASNFYSQVQAAASGGKIFNYVNLNANAQWIAGSLQESGTAQLEANTDGTTKIVLNLNSASRTETNGGIGLARTCEWSDKTGTTHIMSGLNCIAAIPWFAPIFIVQGVIQHLDRFNISDDGEVTKDGATFHQASFTSTFKGTSDDVTKLINRTTQIRIFYNPQTLLPSSIEYAIHPDGDDSRSIGVRIVYSNYQSTSGLMLPFHIEKYVNRSLQLSLDITNAVIN